MVKTPEEIQAFLERHLLRVQKPGRYIGGELNSIQKNWDEVQTKVALVFPDIYDLGLPNLGLTNFFTRILIRVMLWQNAPAPPWDMEAIMRQYEIPAYSLESKHSLADFDIIGFTLPYETLYTNTLNLLDLAGIPLSQQTDQIHIHSSLQEDTPVTTQNRCPLLWMCSSSVRVKK